MIRFSALLPISAPHSNKHPPHFECVFIDKRPYSNKRPHSDKRPHSNIIPWFKENQPCHAGLERLNVVQQAMSNSRDRDSFYRITESDVEDVAPDSFYSRIDVPKVTLSKLSSC